MSPSSQGEAARDPGFYGKLRQHLTEIAFDRRVSDLCETLYWTTYSETDLRIDPVVYFKMLMIGFFENLSGERAIAARCRDGLSVRALLGYDSKEDPPASKNYARSEIDWHRGFMKKFSISLSALSNRTAFSTGERLARS